MSTYSVRWLGPTLIERGRDTTVSVAIEQGGSDITATSATFSLFSPAGEAIVDGATATVAAGTLSYPVLSSAVSSSSYGKGWLVEFTAIIAGATYTFYNDGALCLSKLSPPIGHTDLVTRHSDITNLLPTGTTSTQAYIEAAWADLLGNLYRDGLPFWRLRTLSALREPLLYRALAMVFLDFSTLLDQGDKYQLNADRYGKLAKTSYDGIRGALDTGEDNSISDSSQTPVAPVIMLSTGRRRR